MKHTIEESAHGVVVLFSGDIDLESSPKARKVLLKCVKEHKGVVVNLADVPYMDSSGVATLVEGFQAARKKKSHFALAAVSPAALRVLQLSRLDKVFAIRDSVDEAWQG